MFKDTFPFKFISKQPGGLNDEFKSVYIYTFYSPTEKYIFRGEVFEHEVVAIKYYPKRFENSDQKYNRLTGEGKASRVLGTVIKIMIDIVKERDENSSLVFVGAALIDEGKKLTKRFRIYKKLMENFFSPKSFSHHYEINNSIYLMINKKKKDPNILEKIERHFTDIYEFEPKPEETQEAPSEDIE